MPSISSMGTGSGIDIRGLIDKLVAAEGEARVKKLDKDENNSLSKISAYSSVRSALNEFKQNLNALQNLNDLTQRTATSEDTNIFTANVNSGNIKSASCAIQVNTLAKAQKSSSVDFASPSTIVGTGTLEITINGTVYSLEIGTQDQTLSGIKDKINESFGNVGISANLITVDSGTKIVFSSKNTGVANGFSIAVTNDGDSDNSNNQGLSQLISSRLTTLQVPLDASIKIDNLTVTSSTNYIEDAIEGVTINLLKADPNVDYNLDLSIDIQSTKNKITQFISSYNATISTINDLSGYQTNGADGIPGTLLGDATIRGIQSSLRKSINTPTTPTHTLGLKLLSQIGITTNPKSGELELNATKLQNSLDTNFDEVGNLFANDTDGLASRLNDALSVYTQTGGVLYSRIIGMNESVIDIKKQRLDLEIRLQKLEQRLVSQFTAMDSIISGLNNTGEFLKRAIDGLPEPNSIRK